MNDYSVEGFIPYLPLLAWIGVIMYLSSGKNSVLRTLPFFTSIMEPVLQNTSSSQMAKYYVIVRKVCHFVGYAILALLASVAYSNSSVLLVAQYWYVCGFATTLVVAAADETRQSFESQRVGSLSDVALDCVGGTVAIFLFWIYSR